MQPSFPAGSSYEEVVIQIRKRVRDEKLSEEILALLRSTLETALKGQNIVLSQAEREQISQMIMKEVVNEVMKQVNRAKNA